MTMRSMASRLVHPMTLLDQLRCAVDRKLRPLVHRAVVPFRRDPALAWLGVAVVALAVFLFVLFASPVSRRH